MRPPSSPVRAAGCVARARDAPLPQAAGHAEPHHPAPFAIEPIVGTAGRDLQAAGCKPVNCKPVSCKPAD
jgi:hypothetical protein